MITPEIFLKFFKSYTEGDSDFCNLASTQTEYNGIPINNNCGFWFVVMQTGESIVLSVQYDSLTTDEPVQTVTISGEDELNSFFDQAREWAINVLKS
jgi:hypothetical protein